MKRLSTLPQTGIPLEAPESSKACSVVMVISDAKRHIEVLSPKGFDTCTSDTELDRIQGLVLESFCANAVGHQQHAAEGLKLLGFKECTLGV